jgi:hypothetical protein
MFRSLNSLLESFHQSFFFYLLSSTSRYVSIGLYMPPLGCVMIGPILAAISCWISSVEDKGMVQINTMLNLYCTCCMNATSCPGSSLLGRKDSGWGWTRHPPRSSRFLVNVCFWVIHVYLNKQHLYTHGNSELLHSYPSQIDSPRLIKNLLDFSRSV